MIIQILNNVGILLLSYMIVLGSVTYLLINDVNRYLVIFIGVMLGFIISNVTRKLLGIVNNKE